MIIEKSVIIPAIIISFVAFALITWALYTIFFAIDPSILTYFDQYQSPEPLMALMILICTFAYIILAATLILYLLSYFLFRGDTNDQP